MEGITRFLNWIINNWTAIVAVAGLVYAIYLKAKKTWEDWQSMTEEQKQAELQKQVEAALEILGELILSLVARAEIEYKDEGSKLGPVKRSQVIEEVFDTLPILAMVTDQETLMSHIDELIDEALVIVREKIRTETGAENA